MKLTEGDMTRGAWLAGRLGWKLDSLQLHISRVVNESRAKRTKTNVNKICILSSRQIGKSYWVSTYALEFLIRNRAIARVASPTLGGCHDIVNDNLLKIMEDAPPGLISKKQSDMRWYLQNRSTLRLGALERAHVDSMGRGGNASLIIYEECAFVKGDDFVYGVDSVIGPQLTRSKGGIEIFVSTPPVDPDHPLVTRIKPECEELGTFFSYTIFDSPSLDYEQKLATMIRSGCKLDPRLEDDILKGKINRHNILEEADKTNSILTEAWLREFMAMIIRSSTLMVIPYFSQNQHVLAFDDPMACYWTVTIDWGGVKDKTVALLHTYEYTANLDLIKDERVFPPNTSMNAILAEVKGAWAHLNPAWWADVSGQLQVELNSAGHQFSIPQKSDWLASVQTMANKFTTNEILIHPRCTFLLKTIKAGMFNKAKNDFERNEELGHCDALAALMYGIRSQDRSDPFVKMLGPMSTLHDLPGDIELANAMNPKRFGKFR